jgi:oxygen-independent coproporphyrinogen-3 oxidase
MMMAIRRFLDAGYVHVGMDHFALPEDELARAHASGSLHRNFMGYTTRTTKNRLAFGPSGIGELDSCYVQAHRDLAHWQRHVNEAGLATLRGHRLSDEDQRRGWVIRQIMCRDGVSSDDYRAQFGESFAEHFQTELMALGPMEADGILVRSSTGSFEMTVLGRLLVRNVAMVFDAYLPAQQSTGRNIFSKTI